MPGQRTFMVTDVGVKTAATLSAFEWFFWPVFPVLWYRGIMRLMSGPVLLAVELGPLDNARGGTGSFVRRIRAAWVEMMSVQ